MTWDINKISEQIRQETARNVKQWQNRYRQNNVFDKGGGANRKQGTPSNKEAFIKEMNRELSLRPDLDTPQFKDWLTRLVSLESGYNSNAKSPGSSASGYFQLLKSNRHTGDQWEDMATLTRRNLAAINALSPQLKKMAAEKGLDKWDLLSIAHFQGAGSLAIVIQGANPKDATGFSTSSYLNRMHGRRTKDFNYSYQAPRYEDVDYDDIVPSSQEEEAPAPTENAFLKAINARIAETQAAMDALHEENVQRNPELARNIFASNTEEAPSPNSFLPRITQSAQVPQSNYALEGVPSYDSDEYFNALQQKYMPEYSPLEELMEDTPYNQYLALGGHIYDGTTENSQQMTTFTPEELRRFNRRRGEEARAKWRAEREAYVKTPEGQKRLEGLHKETEAFFHNMKSPGVQKGLGRAQAAQDAFMQNAIADKQFAQDVKTAASQEMEDKKEAAQVYKNAIESTLTAAELGLSGLNLLRAYGNWHKWEQANRIRRGVINLLNKKSSQVTMNGLGTVIDGIQTWDNINNEDYGTAAWNGAGMLLGSLGTLGAMDMFRGNHPRLDVGLDTAGVVQSIGDIGKFAVDNTIFRGEKALGGPVNTNNPIPNFAQNVHQKIPAVRYDEGGPMDLKLPSATNVDFNVQPQESAPELPVNNTSVNTAEDTSIGLGQAFQNQKLPSENVMFPNTSVSREELQQRTAQSWNANKDFNASPLFYDDYGWRVKKHHPEVTDTAFNAVKNTTPIVTRNMGTRLGQYQVKGEYMPQSGSVQIDKYNGVFPDVVAHEMGHAFDYKLNLTGNTPGGNLDRTLLNNAYPTIHGIADEDIEERRAVNTQLRSVIQQKSGKSASDLDTYIQNMDTKAMQNAVKSMHTDYLKSTAVSDESLPAIKNALQDVAFIPLKAIIQQKSGKTGDELDSYIDGLDNKSMQKLLNLQDSKLQSGTISSQSLSALKDDLQNPDIAFNPERALNRAAYGGNIYDGTTESSQQMNNNNSSWWERTTDAVKGFLNIPIEASNRRVSIQKDRGGHYTFNGRTPSEGYTYYDEATGNVYKFIKGKRTLLHQSDSSKKAKKENEKHPLSTEKTKQQDEYIGQAPLYGLQDERTAGGWNSAQLYLNVNPQDRISPGIAMVDGMHYAFDGRDRSYSSKGDEALWLRHLGGTRNMEEMPVRGIRFSGDLESKRNKAEYTGIPDYAKQAILNEIKNGHIEVDPNGAWTQREESMFNNHKDLTQYANFSIRENNDSGIYDVFDTYDFPVEKWYVPNINRYPNKQIEVRDTIHGPNAIPELYDPTFSSKKVRKRYKSLGGTINLFANGGRTQFNKDYPGLAGIQFNVVPDSNFNAKNVGFGNIEYMPQGEQGVQYTPDYYYSNPDPTTNNIVYNPEAYSSQQAVNEAIALDAISHAGHQNATYDALHALLGNEYPKEAVAQARDAGGNDALFDQEMGNPYSETRQFIYPAAVDGQVRAALFEEMHPNKQDSAYEEQNYYPYFREEFQKNESEDANRYLSDLSKYIKTGKKPKYVLPETTVKGKRK